MRSCLVALVWGLMCYQSGGAIGQSNEAPAFNDAARLELREKLAREQPRVFKLRDGRNMSVVTTSSQISKLDRRNAVVAERRASKWRVQFFDEVGNEHSGMLLPASFTEADVVRTIPYAPGGKRPATGR